MQFFQPMSGDLCIFIDNCGRQTLQPGLQRARFVNKSPETTDFAICWL